jgi:hypothetical protein
MKYLTAFLNSGDPWGEYPTKTTKTLDPPSDFRGSPPDGTYKNYENPPDANFVGFVGASTQELTEIWAPVDVEELGPTFLPPDYQPPLPPRPSTPPTYGFTEGGHVVELPRTDGADRRDPLKLVTGASWPAWYPPDPTEARPCGSTRR